MHGHHGGVAEFKLLLNSAKDRLAHSHAFAAANYGISRGTCAQIRRGIKVLRGGFRPFSTVLFHPTPPNLAPVRRGPVGPVWVDRGLPKTGKSQKSRRSQEREAPRRLCRFQRVVGRSVGVFYTNGAYREGHVAT